MAHFAEIDNNNNVLRVLSVPDEQEFRGEEYLRDDCRLGGRWIQTSYNHKIRKRFAGEGMTYDAVADVFYPVKPYESWVKDESVFDWKAPVDKPQDGKNYRWDEPTVSWIEETPTPELK
jgi:hypothetical protein